MAASSWARKAVVLLCASDLLLLLLLLLLLPPPGACMAEGSPRTPDESTPPLRKKDTRDYNDADMAHLLEQWEKDDDIEEGDLPGHKRASAPVDFSKIDPSKPESILKMTKKGKTLMTFVTVSGSPTEEETEEITSLWQGSLFNANYDVQRFIVGSDRAIFMLHDGSYTWEIKDFLVSQDRCADVTLEGQAYPGKGGGSKEKNKTKQDKGKKKKEGDLKPWASKEDSRAGNKSAQLSSLSWVSSGVLQRDRWTWRAPCPAHGVGVVSGNCTPDDILVSSRKGLPHDPFVVKELLFNRLQESTAGVEESYVPFNETILKDVEGGSSAPGIWRAEVRDAAKHLPMHRTAPTTMVSMPKTIVLVLQSPDLQHE
ncbi:LRP chaperone MESD-like [Aotus nancymaae]|uniref:LRP chaperone MESD-like n=1 Tax=Aotus nancymaae TaxID=37293 RepID=UPI0030FE2CAD